MASKAKSRTLTDHDEVRRWAEERGAKPSVVRSTHDTESSGIIRLDFPGYTGEGSLEEIEWDEWFDDFDKNNLALVVQDETANGEQSNFNKLVSRERTDDYSAETTDSEKKTRKSRASSRRAADRKTATRSSRKSATPSESSQQRSGQTEGSRKSGEGRSSSANKKRTSGRKAA